MLLTSLSARFAYWLDHGLSVYWTVRYAHIHRWLDPQSEDILLDVGCGIGRWSKILALSVRSVFAFDVDAVGLEQIKQLDSPILLTRASGLAMPYPNETFSKIVSVDVIEHVPDDLQMVREIFRVLRPGGRVVVTTLIEDRPHYLRKMEFDDHLREYDAEVLAELFERSDLHVDQVFNFYYAQGMLAREIQAMVQQIPLGQSPARKALVVGFMLLIGIFCRLLVILEQISPAGAPGGVGIVAIKNGA